MLCDSSADISEAEAKELGIHVLRMPIIIDNETFTEGVDIFDEDILKALKADKKISTTQPSPGSMLALWDELLKEYDQVLYFPFIQRIKLNLCKCNQLCTGLSRKGCCD